MSNDRYERKHRRTARHPEVKQMMRDADFESTSSLAAAMGLLRCIHGSWFPCTQCQANRSWNETATGRKLTEREFEDQYACQE